MWWLDEVVVAQLGLTPAQTKRIDTIFEEFLPAQRDKWNALRPLEIELDDLLRQSHADEQQAIDLITRLENCRSELSRRRQIMLFRIQQLLTVPQRRKLAALGGPDPRSPR